MMYDWETSSFSSINDRLKLRWNRMLRVLSERSESFWLELAVGAYRRRHFSDAFVNLHQALVINPDNGLAFKLKGMILQRKAYEATDVEQYKVLTQAMLAAYQRAAEVDRHLKVTIEKRLKRCYYYEFIRGVEAFGNGEEDEAAFSTAATYFELAALIRRSITSTMPAPDTPWNAYTNQALSHLNANQPKAAIKAFEEAVQQGDTSTNTLLLLADLHQRYGAYEQAVHVLERADVPSTRAQLETALLNAYLQAGLCDRAFLMYEDAIIREPDNKGIRYNYGTLLLEKEAFDEAEQHLQVAVELDPDDAEAQYNLGAVFFNKAVGIGKAIRERDNQLQANRASMMPRTITQTQAEIDDLVQQQQGLFTQAAITLEQARTLTNATVGDASGICEALFLAYSKTRGTENVEEVLSGSV